jgi:hypothetical protein
MAGSAKNARTSKASTAIGEFVFVDGERTFTCSAEPLGGSRQEKWWWFSVTPNVRNERYAPFRASDDDTRESVQARVVAYHDALLERRSQPATPTHWARRPAAPEQPQQEQQQAQQPAGESASQVA